ncbi:MAG: M16 family metallopeptidase, partial [Gammaproteobacteria bacterium]
MRRFIRLLAATAALALLAPAVAAGPDIQHWTTANGARVYFVEAPEIPMLDVRATFAAGSARDGDMKGIANLTSSLLSEGAGELDADAFSRALGATGAALSTGALRDMAYVKVRSLSEARYAEPALDLFVEAVAAPRFDADALARVKAQAMTSFKHKQQSPGTIAEETFYAKLYADHPYASPPDGTEASEAAIEREDVMA